MKFATFSSGGEEDAFSRSLPTFQRVGDTYHGTEPADADKTLSDGQRMQR